MKGGEVGMGLTERHWFENEDVPENYEWALEDAVYNSRVKPSQIGKVGEVGMTDRDKVIKTLQGIRIALDMDGHPNDAQAVADALALLKEQEAQFVLNIGQQISCKSGSCPKCGKMLNTTCNKRYCGDCGQAVKWE